MRLGSLIEVNPESIRSDYPFSEIEYIDISSVGTGTLQCIKPLQLKDAPSRAKRIVRDGDTLLATVRPNLRSFWLARNPSLNTIASTGFAVLRAGDEIDARFLYFTVTNQPFTDYLTANAKGAAYPAVDTGTIERAEIYLPRLPTQRKIAGILSAYDDLIENNLRRIKILEEMAQDLYREWFVKFRFPGHQHARFSDSPLGKIPEGWEVEVVQNVIKRGKPGKLYDQKTASPVGAVPILDQGRSGIIGYHNDKPGVSPTEDQPVIVFANHTCYQKIVQYPFSAIQNVIPFTPAMELPRNIYWLHWATKDLVEFNDYKGHWPEFMSKELLVPEPGSTVRFGEQVEPMVRLIYRFETKNRNLRRTRDLLLPKLISGEVDVSELDIAVPEEAAA